MAWGDKRGSQLQNVLEAAAFTGPPPKGEYPPGQAPADVRFMHHNIILLGQILKILEAADTDDAQWIMRTAENWLEFERARRKQEPT